MTKSGISFCWVEFKFLRNFLECENMRVIINVTFFRSTLHNYLRSFAKLVASLKRKRRIRIIFPLAQDCFSYHSSERINKKFFHVMRCIVECGMAIDDQERTKNNKLYSHTSNTRIGEWIYTHDVVPFRPEVKPHVCAICSWYDDDVSESFYRNA